MAVTKRLYLLIVTVFGDRLRCYRMKTLSLSWRPLITIEIPLPKPAILHSDCGRGMGAEDAESMGYENKPLLDYSNKEYSIGGITMHPL